LLGCGAQSAAQAAPSPRAAAHEVTVLTEPQAGVTPFVDMIDGAHTSVDLTMYELSDQRVERPSLGPSTAATTSAWC